MDWLNLLAVQGTLKSLLQHHSSKASILWCPALYSPTLTSLHDYWKNHSIDQMELCWQSNVCFLICCLGFLPRSKYLLISWLQSPSAVILEPRKIKSLTVSIVSPPICHKVMGPDAMILAFLMLCLSQFFHSPLYFHQEALQFFFTFCHKGVVI